jgi:hypothetical protein
MARGIVVGKPGAGMPNGRIIMIEGVVPSGDGRAAAIDPGTVVQFTENTSAQIGYLVDCTVTNNIATGIVTQTPGTVLTGPQADSITVASGQVITLKACTLEGKVTINGGTAILIGGTTIDGKVEAPVAGSVLLVDNQCVINGKLEVNTASLVSVRNSTIDGKLTTNGTNFTAVTGCTIIGKLEVINSNDCYTANNNVDGVDNSGNCRQ